MSFLARIFGARKQRAALEPLYRAVVAAARDPFWYRDGQVPDTVDGRFDMLAAVAALVLIRLEQDGEPGREPAVLLTELFIDDMDRSLREIGVSDPVVGKHVGRMVGALGGRLGAFRLAPDGLEAAVRRNVFHEAPPSPDAPARVAARLGALGRALGDTPTDALLAGRMPPP